MYVLRVQERLVAEASLSAMKMGQAVVASISGSLWAESPWLEANKDVQDVQGPKWALTDCIVQQGNLAQEEHIWDSLLLSLYQLCTDSKRMDVYPWRDGWRILEHYLQGFSKKASWIQPCHKCAWMPCFSSGLMGFI